MSDEKWPTTDTSEIAHYDKMPTPAAADGLEQWKARAEQAETQLAGCGVAALGWSRGEQRAKPGDWGYSASYQDVLNLRESWEATRKELEAGVALVESAFAHVSHGGPTRSDAEKWLKQAQAILGKHFGAAPEQLVHKWIADKHPTDCCSCGWHHAGRIVQSDGTTCYGQWQEHVKSAGAALRAREQAARLERERCIGILEFYGHKGMANALREELP